MERLNKKYGLDFSQVLSWTLNLMKEKIIDTNINMRHSYELFKMQKCQSLLCKNFKHKFMRFHIKHHGD